MSKTLVTATVIDPDGLAYAFGSWSAVLVGVSNPTVNLRNIAGAYAGNLDINGSFTCSLDDNATISPGGSKWRFTIGSGRGTVQESIGTGAQSFTVDITITGASQSISATLSAAAPALSFPVAGGSVAFSAITSGTNTGQTLIVGNGSSLAPSGTGTITANTVAGAAGLNFVGATSGSAKISVAAVAGSPNQINLPTTTANPGDVLSSDGGNPQQLSWIAPAGGGIGGSIAATEIAIGTGANTIGGDLLHVVLANGLMRLTARTDTDGVLQLLPNSPTQVGALLDVDNGSTATPTGLDVVRGTGIGGNVILRETIQENQSSYAHFTWSKAGPAGCFFAEFMADDGSYQLNSSPDGVKFAGLLFFSDGSMQLSPDAGSPGILFGNGKFLITPVGVTTWQGSTSGSAAISVAAVAGTPNVINLPIATGAAGQFLQTDGSNPQQTSWAAASAIVGSDNHATEVTGNYGPVTLFTPGAAGLFRVCGYLEASTAVVASTALVTVSYTDDTGANSQSTVATAVALLGASISFSFVLRSTAAAISYATTTANNPKYKIFARVEKL